ncbi:Proteasome subunit beta type-4 [Monosporozyma unispora]|nr:Proteasome subunit beta type-4 [Kazachstania unispora]
MDILLGIKVKGSVILATSKAVTRGISVLKADDDKTRQLTPYSIMGFTGEAGDTVQFSEYIQANMKLYSTRENHDLPVGSVASFVRLELAKSLRSRKPFQVNVLIGGVDTKKGDESESVSPHLYQIDYLGTQVELPYAAHGYAGFYTFSLLDHHYRPDMSLDEGLALLKQCIAELEKRMPMDFKGVFVKVVDKDGVRTLEDF